MKHLSTSRLENMTDIKPLLQEESAVSMDMIMISNLLLEGELMKQDLQKNLMI